VELNNVTLEQALEIAHCRVRLSSSGHGKHYFCDSRPAEKRRDYEEQVVKTLYVSNTVQPQELTEIVTGCGNCWI